MGHTSYPWQAKSLEDLGLFHRWLSSPFTVSYPQSTPCMLTLDLHVSPLPPKALWCPSPLCKFRLPFKAQVTQMEPLGPSQGTFVPGQKGEEREGRGGACGLGLGKSPSFSPVENHKSNLGVK